MKIEPCNIQIPIEQPASLISVDRNALSVLLEATEHRSALWNLVATGQSVGLPGDGSIDEFYEADSDEAAEMVEILNAAIESGYQALKR